MARPPSVIVASLVFSQQNFAHARRLDGMKPRGADALDEHQRHARARALLVDADALERRAIEAAIEIDRQAEARQERGEARLERRIAAAERGAEARGGDHAE